MSSRRADIVAVVATVLALVATVAFVRRQLEPPPPQGFARRPVADADAYAADGRRYGALAPQATLVEFSDFQCPYCKRLHGSLAQLLARHPGKVAVVYRHYPLVNHSLAFPAALAAECAGQQGRFPQYAALAFEKQDSLSFVTSDEIAERAGVPDLARFRSCRQDAATRAVIDRDIAAGEALHLQGTPGLLIDGKLLEGALPVDTLEAILRNKLDH
jgi:protein-disulfide isomerase